MIKKLLDKCIPSFLMMLLLAVAIVFISGVWRWILGAVFAVFLIDLTVSARKVIREYRPKPNRDEQNAIDAAWFAEHQDPAVLKVLRIVNIAQSTITIIVSFGVMIGLEPFGFWCIASILCLAMQFILLAAFPAYFSLGELDRERKKRCNASALSLLLPFMISWSLMGIGSLDTFGILSWKSLGLAFLEILFVMAIILRIVVPECRKSFGNWAACVLLLAILGPGMTLPINYLLDFQAPTTIETVILAKRVGGYRSSPSITIDLGDGRKVEIPIDNYRDRKYDIGNKIVIERRTGALGVEVVNLPET